MGPALHGLRHRVALATMLCALAGLLTVLLSVEAHAYPDLQAAADAGSRQSTHGVLVTDTGAPSSGASPSGATKAAALPNGGGPRTVLLGVGVALVLAGWAAVTRARRREDSSAKPVVTGVGRRDA